MKNNIHSGYLHEEEYTYFIISRSFLLTMRYISDKLCRENQNTQLIFNNFFSEIRALYQIMWKNMAEIDRPRMTIWRMRMACWIPKFTNTHSECVITTAFPLQQRLQEHSLVFCLYVHCLICYK
jgi:hypothetical protein